MPVMARTMTVAFFVVGFIGLTTAALSWLVPSWERPWHWIAVAAGVVFIALAVVVKYRGRPSPQGSN